MLSEIAVAFIAAVAGLLAVWLRKTFSYWEDRGVVFVKPNFLYGNFKGVSYEYHVSERLQEYYELFKNKAKIVGLYVFTVPVILVTDLDIVKEVMVNHFNVFNSRGEYVNKEDPLSLHLLALDGIEWRNMRTSLTPSFTSGKIKLMFDSSVNYANRMVELLKNATAGESKDIEMKNRLTRFTTDIIADYSLGLEANSMTDPDTMFWKITQNVFVATAWQRFKLLFALAFPNAARTLKIKKVGKKVSDIFLSTIKQTIAYREANNILRNDAIGLLMQIKNIETDDGEVSGKLTIEETAAQALLFYLAGTETSSSTVTFALYELALNQRIQDSLREEINCNLMKNGGHLTYEALAEMKYLQMIINETFRRHPTVDRLGRQATKDFKIPGTNVKLQKGTIIAIPVLAIHNDEKIYPEPHKFDPERFNSENQASRHPMAFLPFGEGPRACIGLRFGMMTVKIALIKLIANFKFSPADRTTIPMQYHKSAMFLHPIDDMWLKVEKL